MVERTTHSRAEIEARIEAAFGGATMPRTAAELTTGGIDGPYVVKHFLGRSRGEMEAQLLAGLHMEDFRYMTPQAVAYYLPAALRRMLSEPDDAELWIFLSSCVRDQLGVTWLSAEQRRALADWARFMSAAFEVLGGFDGETAQALALAAEASP
ncbi:hypothetical protein PPSIR1_24169 [Plesiocystis pacifica SIR-1]|uniref:Uncharacterized protein n=1 Tax=Plesiocystis pacifica SIR-1 TaxID=391625 RepID=A6GBZ8_9BACT|nr:hypothetical protein [Plesiocystis pacifica]EDM76560.1 hypothetical protein PPSIR1_24169 [Plesiocystis pacifica SIR-1]